MSRLRVDWAAFRVEQYADECAKRYVAPAFQGDVEAASFLAAALSNAKRGAVALAMWQAKVPQEAFRAYLCSVWLHDHQYVVAAAQTRRRLACMFRYARFELPSALRQVVKVWRGTKHSTFKQARQGYSWTTDRDVACWFAIPVKGMKGSPLVLVAEVTKAEIAFFNDERSESEVVLLKAPRGATVDGDLTDWRRGSHRYESAKNAEQTRKLISFKRVHASVEAVAGAESINRPRQFRQGKALLYQRKISCVL
jgi:hypothetical protein